MSHPQSNKGHWRPRFILDFLRPFLGAFDRRTIFKPVCFFAAFIGFSPLTNRSCVLQALSECDAENKGIIVACGECNHKPHASGNRWFSIFRKTHTQNLHTISDLADIRTESEAVGFALQEGKNWVDSQPAAGRISTASRIRRTSADKEKAP
jgi:hypothetical protein